MNESPAIASTDASSSACDLTVVREDGERASVDDGEFRSQDGKLLFIRRGSKIEIRCPRSKELYVLEWGPESEAALESEQNSPNSALLPSEKF